jgi:hypothetical protein
MMMKKTVFAFAKCTKVLLTLIHFCRYQLTVVAIQMLLIGGQFVKAVLMLGWKPNVL